MNLRIGQGWDTHRLVEHRPLMLGGLEIPSPKGEEAHSDGDVLIHAIIDGLLGALALGDIGSFYPPSDEKWKGISSAILLKETVERVKNRGYSLVNLDCTVILEQPKLKAWKLPIRKNLAKLLETSIENVSLKAKTAEKVGPVGQGLSIEASAAVLLTK